MRLPATTVSSTVLPQREKAGCHPYSHSIASSASSSSDSIFSNDEQSSQSSAPSSVKSASIAWEDESGAAAREAVHVSAGSVQSQRSSISPARPTLSSHPTAIRTSCTQKPCTANNAAVAPELRVHPRRTQPPACADSQDGKANAPPPPSLVRQCDRKDNFVEGLVDTTTQMIEAIWPLSVPYASAKCDAVNKNLIDLRTFIQEVLKRSKTSYSTLQVALYYLVLIKSRVPSVNFTQEQFEDSHASRAMQCGRRMFLAALILASKYLQDRNYSARAWSKISGLKVCEINENEMAFLTAVEWKIHIPEARFQRWTDVVLKFSLSPAASAASHGRMPPDTWKSVIPLLNAELDRVDLNRVSTTSLTARLGRSCGLLGTSAQSTTSPFASSTTMSPPPVSGKSSCNALAISDSQSPHSKLEALEPSLTESRESFRFPPISPRITQLPTPQLTPRTNAFYPAPAASLCASGHYRGKSMRMAMRDAEKFALARCAYDVWPNPAGLNGISEARHPQQPFQFRSRQSSVCPSVASAISSPESTFSDASSLSTQSSVPSSRASSVCSRQFPLTSQFQQQQLGTPTPTSRSAMQTPTSTPTPTPTPRPNCGSRKNSASSGIFMDNTKGHRSVLAECLSASPSTFVGMAPESFIRGASASLCSQPQSHGRDDSEAAAAMALKELAFAPSVGSSAPRPTHEGAACATRPVPSVLARSTSFLQQQRKRERSSMESIDSLNGYGRGSNTSLALNPLWDPMALSERLDNVGNGNCSVKPTRPTTAVVAPVVLEDAKVADSFLLRGDGNGDAAAAAARYGCFRGPERLVDGSWSSASFKENMRSRSSGSGHARSESGARFPGGARKRVCSTMAVTGVGSALAQSPATVQWAPVN